MTWYDTTYEYIKMPKPIFFHRIPFYNDSKLHLRRINLFQSIFAEIGLEKRYEEIFNFPAGAWRENIR